MTLAVIIPMFNEQINAEKCVRAVCEVISHIDDIKLFVVNDGSSDKTHEILTDLLNKNIQFQLSRSMILHRQ